MVFAQRDKSGIHTGDRGGWSDGGGFRQHEALPIPTKRLGLWLFLGSVTMLFAGFSSAYLVRMALPDAGSIIRPPLLWVNTGLLLLSSLSVQLAWQAARKGNQVGLQRGLLITTLLGFAFLAGQLLVWRQLVAAGVYLQTNPASSFFYVLTAAHGLHLLGGLAVLIWAYRRAHQRTYMPVSSLDVELCAVYWHFLTVLWLWVLLLLVLR